ncbi:MED7-domain-containing protein [Trichodelitschia bisporula]|uniref:Mediator of RNA polymerase II transcription subunit 7 n=1 Tax=Trichodelitschia bisporula TaxID=703511 RepID=A0A6G1HSN4_9PEZI|nr:MED7-domain-containing protein [Trichodelitschia bisporula]
MLLSFLELVGVMGLNPPLVSQKLEHLTTLYLNAHHLINEYRPHQARETLITMLEEQVQRKRAEVEGVRRLAGRVEQLMGELGREAAAVNEGGEEKKEEGRWEDEQRNVWAALEEVM